MKLRNIEFGNVLGASGVQGFFGEGYWFHRAANLVGIGPNFSGITFVGKTVTLSARPGNMRLKDDHTPAKWFPDCVSARPLQGVMVNSVGLSNHGIYRVLDHPSHRQRTEPFWLSVMSVADSPQGRREELRSIAKVIAWRRKDGGLIGPFGVQINLSCPNTGHDPAEMMAESEDILDIFATELPGVPLMPKYSVVSTGIAAAMQLEKHQACDAICVSNTVPFGWKGFDHIRRDWWWGDTSPLAKRGYGDGGISGNPLRYACCHWIKSLRDRGFTKPINGGGGILHPDHVNQYYRAGASSVFVGSVAMLRPWRVRRIIERANSLDWSIMDLKKRRHAV